MDGAGSLLYRKVKIPQATIERLALYAHFLQQAEAKGITRLSSDEMGRRLGVSAHTIRRDLNYFGEFGVQGVGYEVSELRQGITSVLGVQEPWQVIVVGAGRLGEWILNSRELKDRGFRPVAAFDRDPRRVGQVLAGVPVLPMTELGAFTREHVIKVAVVAVPAAAAQEAAEAAIAGGSVKGILNLTSEVLRLPWNIEVANLDPAASLQVLAYRLQERAEFAG